MNNNRKIDVNKIFLATIRYDEDVTSWGIFKMTNKIINIDTLANYKITAVKDNKLKLDNNVELKGIVPITDLYTGLNGKCSINEILILCEKIDKKYDNNIDEFVFKNPFELQHTLAIIKPDGMSHIEEIIEMFYKNDLKIKQFKIENLSEEKVDEHYSHLLDKSFYPKLKNYMMSAPVAIMILEGNNAVDKLRNLMGPTDSTKAQPDTIRGKFGTDITYNAIHGSDSKENAKIEINRFFSQKQKRITK